MNQNSKILNKKKKSLILVFLQCNFQIIEYFLNYLNYLNFIFFFKFYHFVKLTQ